MWFPLSAIKQATILSTLLFASNLRSVFVGAQESSEALLNDLPNYYGPKFQQYQANVQMEINKLNVTYPPAYGSVNPFDVFVNAGLLEDYGWGIGITTIVASPGLLSFPTKCTDREFGVSGEFTDQVCRTIEVFSEICASEPTCDTNKLPTVVPGKADVLKDTQTVALVVCLNKDPTPLNCITIPGYVTTYYVPTVMELQGLVESAIVPGNYANPLFTNAENSFAFVDFATGNNEISDHHVIGDTYYTLRGEALDSIEEREADITTDVLIALVDRTYVEYPLADTRTNYFKAEFLAGYFGKLYNKDFYPYWAVRKEVMPLSSEMRISNCAMSLGILVAQRCGLDPNEAGNFFDHYLSALPTDGVDETTTSGGEFFCSPFRPRHYYKAEKFMRKSSRKKSPSTVTLTNELCMRALWFL